MADHQNQHDNHFPSTSSSPADRKLWRRLLFGVMIVMGSMGMLGGAYLYYYFQYEIPQQKREAELRRSIQRNEQQMAQVNDRVHENRKRVTTQNELKEINAEAIYERTVAEEKARRTAELATPPLVEITVIIKDDQGEVVVDHAVSILDPLDPQAAVRRFTHFGRTDAEGKSTCKLRVGWLYRLKLHSQYLSPLYLPHEEFIRVSPGAPIVIEVKKRDPKRVLPVTIEALHGEVLKVDNTQQNRVRLRLLGELDGLRYTIKNYSIGEGIFIKDLPDQRYAVTQVKITNLKLNETGIYYEHRPDWNNPLVIENGKIVSPNQWRLKLDPEINKAGIFVAADEFILSDGDYIAELTPVLHDGSMAEKSMKYKVKVEDGQVNTFQVPIGRYRLYILDESGERLSSEGRVELDQSRMSSNVDFPSDDDQE